MVASCLDKVITRNSSFFRKFFDLEDGKFDPIEVIKPVENNIINEDVDSISSSSEDDGSCFTDAIFSDKEDISIHFEVLVSGDESFVLGEGVDENYVVENNDQVIENAVGS